MISGRGSGDDAGSGILDQLKLMERFMWKTEEEDVTIIDAEVTREWMRIAVVFGVRDGRRRFMLRRWKIQDSRYFVVIIPQYNEI